MACACVGRCGRVVGWDGDNDLNRVLGCEMIEQLERGVNSMGSGILLPLSLYQGQIIDLLKTDFKLSDADITRYESLHLDDLANLVVSTIKRELIRDFGVYEIVVSGINQVLEHAKAAETLRGSSASMVHSRCIEEMIAVLRFVISSTERYSEFAWRWNNFHNVTQIRNRLFTLKQSLDTQHLEWIDNNKEQLKTWIKKTFKFKLQQDWGIWEKYNNWLFPLQIKDIFEQAGSSNSYQSGAYSWNSHAVHFSPVKQGYFGLQTPDGSYPETMKVFDELNIVSLFKVCLPIAKNKEILRIEHAKLLYIHFYNMSISSPERFERVFLNNDETLCLRNYLRQPSGESAFAVMSILGKEPDDPHLLKFSS